MRMYLLWFWCIQTLFVGIFSIGQDGGTCDDTSCYFAARSPVDEPDKGNWVCQNEYKDAKFVNPLNQSAYDVVSGLLGDLSDTLTLETLYAPDENAEPFQQIIPFCGGTDDEHLFTFHFGDVNGDGRTDFACHQDYDGYIRWCTDWTSLGHCELFLYTGWCREHTETNTFEIGNFMSGLGHDTIMCMVSNGYFYVSYAGNPSERSHQINNQAFCTGEGRLHFNDINNDGIMDIICNTPDAQPSNIAILSNGDGSVGTDSVVITANYWCNHVDDIYHTGDFNGDNLIDNICIATHTGHIYVEIGTGDLPFAGASTWGEGLDFCLNTEAAVIIGDFNADGLDDVGCHHPFEAIINITYSQGSEPFFQGVDRTIENFCRQTSYNYKPRVFAERLHEGEGHTIVCVRGSRTEAGIVGATHSSLEWTWSSSDEPVTSLTWGEVKSSQARYETYNCGTEGTVFYEDYILMYAYGSSHLCTIVLDEDPSIGASQYTFTLHVANIGINRGTSTHGHYGLTYNWQDENNYEYIYLLPHRQNEPTKACVAHGKVIDGSMIGVGYPGCASQFYHKGWTTLSIEVDYSRGIVKAYIDGNHKADWRMVFGGGRVGACAYNPGQQAIVAYSYFDVNPGILGTHYQPEYVWKTYNCLTNENVVSTDGTFTISGDPGREWSASGYCLLTAMDATPYNNDYEFSVYLHFSDGIDVKQAGIIFNVLDDQRFDVLYLRPYIGACVVYGYYDQGHSLSSGEISCGNPGIHNNDWNLIHVTVKSEDKLVTLFINGDYIHSWNYHFSGGAVGANTLNGFANTINFKDFKLQAREWTSHNCETSGWYDIVNQQFVMDTKPSPGASWPEDAMCHSVYTGSSLPYSGQGYVLTGKMDLESATGHPGVLFHWQDASNYEFFFVRPQNAGNCFQKGVVTNGVVNSTGDNTLCGDADGVGDDWIDFKLVVDSENSLATAYIDSKFAKEWSTEWTTGGIGGAALNGFTNTITYRDLQVGRLDGSLSPKNYETYNCGTGQTIFGDEIELSAESSIGWYDGHFCHVVATTIPCTEEYMYFEMQVSSVGPTSTDNGHPALLYDWKNENSYSFFYLRPHSSTDCFEYGYFDNGSPSNPPIDIDCTPLGITVAANSPNTYAVEIFGTAPGSTVKFYVDGVEMHSWTTHFPRGRVGFGTVNLAGSDTDGAKANYFAPEGLACRPGKPGGLEDDFAIISGKDGLTYGMSEERNKDLLKPICVVPSDVYNSDDEHIVFRVASGAGGSSSSLYDLWMNDAVEPVANVEIGPSYFSQSGIASDSLLKSPIVDMAWDYVSEAKVTFYKHGNPVASLNFDVSGLSKSQWFSTASLVASSYPDMEDNTPSLSLEGFKAARNILDCDGAEGWVFVSDKGSSGSCAWDVEDSKKPAFFYSSSGQEDGASNWAQADVLTVSVKLDDSAFGGSCVSNCLDVENGTYASCYACNVYASCSGEVLNYKSCHHEYEFDIESGSCTESSSSCTGDTATGIHLPDVCDEIVCDNGGQCNMATTGWECVCPEGYEGMNCEINIDDCEEHQCQNGAGCTDGVAEYTCVCTDGWKGDLCDDFDYCYNDTCVNGDCTDGIDDYTCDCQSGYTGKDCDEEDRCILDNVQCVHGDCVPEDGSCVCEDGFLGDLCDTDDPCKPNPCNVGTCSVSEDLQNTECACPTHYSGDHCETYDDCGVDPCQHEGNCTDIGDDFECVCVDGYMGKDCSVVDRCHSEVTCANEGTCQSPDGTCECAVGWMGTLCEHVDYCKPDPCNNHGKCDNIEGGYTCDCNEAFVGVNCSLDNPCFQNSNQCQNGGTCVADNLADVTCDCVDGFEGDSCENGPCEIQKPCGSNGTCSNLEGGNYQCDCDPEFVGQHCNIVNPCNTDPCGPQETCEPKDDGTHTCETWNVQDSASGLRGTFEASLLVSLLLTLMLY